MTLKIILQTNQVLSLVRCPVNRYIHSYEVYEGRLLMCEGFETSLSSHRFCMSDSSVVTRTSPGRKSRTGANGENTYGVVMGTCPRFIKADGAGAMRTKRSRGKVVVTSSRASEYIRVTRGVS